MERNYGIDLLRMLAMFMIVILHVLGVGGIIEGSVGFTFNNQLGWLIEIACYCAVNCYALISGYVGYKSKYKYTNIIMLWLQVVFYMLIITIGCAIFTPLSIGFKEIINIFFPIMTGQYWYFTAYFMLFLVMPILNIAINKLPKKQMGFILIGLVITLSIFPTLLGKDIFFSNKGYSPFWLMVLYLIGGYIKKYDSFSSVGKISSFSGYLFSVLFTFLSKIILENFNVSNLWKIIIVHPFMFVEYTAPAILVASVCLLLFFSRLSLKKLKRVIKFMAPLSFGVYLIHSNILLAEVALSKKLVFLGKVSPPKMVVSVLGLSLLIYFACSVCDFVRLFIFKKLKIKEKVLSLEAKYIDKKILN